MKDMGTGPKARLGFVGLGWIGRHRMQALLDTGQAEAVALADADAGVLAEALAASPDAGHGAGLESVLAARPDGVVIATPSALHADESIAALNAGAAVFCQKPLGRTADEARAVVRAARQADRLLGVDLSYRHTAAFAAALDQVRSGAIGRVTVIDLTFHNAYGPDKPWFRDRRLSGGGCLIDLGTHLVDFALAALGWPDLRCRSAHLSTGGRRMDDPVAVEDLALATLEAEDGTPIRLACSWNLPAGCDAVIRADIFGTGGAVRVTNVNGSFYDFAATRCDGCAARPIAEPPDDWGGRAAAAWLDRLQRDRGYDPACERLVTVAEVIDGIYAAT